MFSLLSKHFGRVNQKFFGGVKCHFCTQLLLYFWQNNRFFCLLVIFFTSKNLASFLVILVQVVQGSQKSLYTGLTHHPGIVQSWSLRSENLRGLGSQENSGCSSDTTPTNWSCFDRIHIWFVTNINPLSDGIQIKAVLIKTLKMKLQSHVRGQNRGSWVCPVHLDYFQLADMCISRVFTWF